MLRRTSWAAALSLLAVIGLACGPEGSTTTTTTTDETTPAETSPTDSTPDAAAPGTPEAAEGEAAATVELSEEDIAQIDKLPEADRAIALAQKICPVQDEPLGSMGMPVKVMANDTAVFVCCKGCVADVEADPDAILVKLGKK